MKIFSLFSVIIMLSVSGCIRQNVKNITSVKSDSFKAISLCMSEYSKTNNKTLFDDVSRIYVHVSLNKFGIIFARGEVGTFSKRSENYKAYLSCGIINKDRMEIFFLGEPNNDAIVRASDINKIEDGFYDSDVLELLFLKDENDIQFYDLQPLSENNFDIHDEK